ncbi:hypothetical protein [Sediminibacillus sp. JSM 1682029]|uniref:hypothetical protein n=1 Tax=Sediminibacillus sp. JSM 1682029 TaxID=3229857 RepID=UPI0003F584C2
MLKEVFHFFAKDPVVPFTPEMEECLEDPLDSELINNQAYDYPINPPQIKDQDS